MKIKLLIILSIVAMVFCGCTKEIKDEDTNTSVEESNMPDEKVYLG